MAIHLSKIHIGHFRGISDLNMDHLNHLNLIAGDNNSGKTSVLEALLLLKNPDDFSNVLLVARQRDYGLGVGPNMFRSFMNLFPKDQNELSIQIDAAFKGNPISFKLTGRRKKVWMDEVEIESNHQKKARASSNHEAEAFEGTMVSQIASRSVRIPVDFHEFQRISGREIKTRGLIPVSYLSPIDHIVKNTFDAILRNEKYKELCLTILRVFDPDIVDLFLLKDLDGIRTSEYVGHKRLGAMPLSTYGDGIKKVLSISNSISRAAGGLLLIDEVETAIHSKYFAEIFKFIEIAAIQAEVQVFVTTHSIEASTAF